MDTGRVRVRDRVGVTGRGRDRGRSRQGHTQRDSTKVAPRRALFVVAEHLG